LQVLANVPAFYFGTSPNKFFDYISAGLPVLNNYPGWLADLLNDSGAGVAVPPDDVGAFADALIDLADHRDQLSAMSQAASALAHERFDRNILGERFVQWLEETFVTNRSQPVKRTFDFLASAAGLLVLSPVL